ncbi:MAG: type II toxin-antitoxin system RelE/ParE family toxin [Vulcanimicrobiaceae bacterium]
MGRGRPGSRTGRPGADAPMRELRIQHQGRPFRLLYAFDSRRTAIILVGGDKGGDDRWYDVYIPIADKLYARHLQEIDHEAKPKEVP